MKITRKTAEQLAGGDEKGDGTRSKRGLPSTASIRNLSDKELIEVLRELGVEVEELITKTEEC